MKLFENKVGRPSNDILKKRKIFYASIVAAFVLVVIGVILVVNNLSPNYLEGATASSNKFVVESNESNCYTVYKPTQAKYWRVHVYYSSSTVIPVYKILSNQKYDHYNDNVSTQKVCFTKQKNTNESFRIYVKWSVDNKDTTYDKSKGSWKPDGWSYNKSIGYAYNSYNVDWSKSSSVATTKKAATTLKATTAKATTAKATTAKATTAKSTSILNVLKEPLDVIVTKYAGTPNKDNVSFVARNTNHSVGMRFQNKTGVTKYYRWAIWNSMYENPNYIGYNGGCVALSNGSVEERNYGVSVNDTYPVRKGVFRLYDSESQCTGDNNLNGSFVKQIKFTYVSNHEAGKVSIAKYVRDSKGTAVKPNSSGNYIVTKEDTYYINYVLHNYTGKKYYANFFTYSTYDYNSSKPSYGKTDYCFEYNPGVIKNPSLGVTLAYNNRAGKFKVYSSMDYCKKDKDGTATKGVIVTAPVKVGINKTATNSKGYVQLKYNIKDIDKNVGTQTASGCFDYATKYGLYVLSGKTSGGGWKRSKSKYKNSYIDLYNLLVAEINAGRPVMVKTTGNPQHYILITGYKSHGSTTLNANNFLNYFWSIDPYSPKNPIGSWPRGIKGKGYLVDGVASQIGFEPKINGLEYYTFSK